MPNAAYKRCRARVVDLWSPEPITDSSVAQRVAAELAGTLEVYPPAHAVDQRTGVYAISTYQRMLPKPTNAELK